MMQKKLKCYLKLMRFTWPPIGTFLLLWPTLWGLWLAARGWPTWKNLFIFIAGVIIMRAAGCVINDIADRDFDRHVKRTKERPLTSGKVTLAEAIVLFVLLCISAFALVLLLNPLAILLAFIGLGIVIVYPFLKRITHGPQVILGLAFAWGVPMAFAAQSGVLSAITWWLYLPAALWPVAYDTMYAMVDRDDDLKIGIKSTAILFGRFDRFVIGMIQLAVVALLGWVGNMSHLKMLYFIFIALAGTTFIYQQHLIKNRDRDRCFKAFLNNSWSGFFIFLGFVFGM
ncbi:MAG: 4-hydroxybenzoate octaprenyltransferase [Gammaproteobacteria bacterium]